MGSNQNLASTFRLDVRRVEEELQFVVNMRVECRRAVPEQVLLGTVRNFIILSGVLRAVLCIGPREVSLGMGIYV